MPGLESPSHSHWYPPIPTLSPHSVTTSPPLAIRNPTSLTLLPDPLCRALPIRAHVWVDMGACAIAGVVIIHLDPNSPAAQSGAVQPGDVLVSIDGLSLRGHDQSTAEEIIARHEARASVTVAVDGFVPESMLKPFMQDRLANADVDEVELLARVQGMSNPYVPWATMYSVLRCLCTRCHMFAFQLAFLAGCWMMIGHQCCVLPRSR